MGFFVYLAETTNPREGFNPHHNKTQQSQKGSIVKPTRTRTAGRYGLETRFDWAVADESPTYKTAATTEIERLKDRMLIEKLSHLDHPDLNPLLRRAANEAAALAWATPFPLLVFPELFEEKARDARRHATTQADVRARSNRINHRLLAEVAA